MVNVTKHTELKEKAIRLKGRNNNGTFKQQYPKKRDTQLKITVSRDFRDAVKEFAEKENKSVTNLIIDALVFYYENH